MIYQLRRSMYVKLGNDFARVINYINENFGLRDEVVGLRVIDDYPKTWE